MKPVVAPSLSPETFRFLRELAGSNRKAWMDANRGRYESAVVAPMRDLVAALAPSVLALEPGFDARPRFGTTLSRINRDIRFAKDKTPYRTRMYVQFSRPASGGGQLFVGVGGRELTAGFRVYGATRDSTLRRLGRSRALDNPEWLRAQARRLGRRYESYWYVTAKGRWTRREGFPARPEDWERLWGWVVRRGFTPKDATQAGFPRAVGRVFEDLFPLYAFTSLTE